MNVNLKAVLFLSQVSISGYFVSFTNSSANISVLFYHVQYVAKGMVERGEGGAIVNVSSLSSLCALKDHAVYCGYCKTSPAYYCAAEDLISSPFNSSQVPLKAVWTCLQK